jgi:hypothetical protein
VTKNRARSNKNKDSHKMPIVNKINSILNDNKNLDPQTRKTIEVLRDSLEIFYEPEQ